MRDNNGNPIAINALSQPQQTREQRLESLLRRARLAVARNWQHLGLPADFGLLGEIDEELGRDG